MNCLERFLPGVIINFRSKYNWMPENMQLQLGQDKY